MVLPSLCMALAACSASDSPAGLAPSDLTPALGKYPPIASMTVSPSPVTIAVGSYVKLGVWLKDASGNDIPTSSVGKIQWRSSDTLVATVNSNGVVTGKHNGAATITARVSSSSASAAVTVGTGTSTSTTSTSTSTSTTSTSTLTSTSTSTTSTSTTPSSSTGAGVFSGAYLFDDFSKYSSTTDLLAHVSTAIGGTATSGALYDDGWHTELAEIDPSVTYNGHATMKYNQPGGTSATPALWVYFPGGQTLSRMWYRVKIRFSPGYTTDGTLANYGKGYKLLGWGWANNNGRGSLELGNITQYYIVWGATTSSTTTAYGGTADVTGGYVKNEWQDGNWYEYIVLFEKTSATTVRQRWWMAQDGQTPVLRGDQHGSMTSGDAPNVNRIMLGMNFNQTRAADQNQALWYGQWEVVDGTQYANPFGLSGL